jgi:hypothetical protein
MVENDFETADEESDALAATYALKAYAVLFRHISDSGLGDLADECPWADKVETLLFETMATLEDMAREEVRLRPGMLEAGRAYLAEFMGIISFANTAIFDGRI